MTAPLACWRCEQPGHGYADCQRPAARDDNELRERINRYIERVIEGHITAAQKRQYVAAEWAAIRKARAK